MDQAQHELEIFQRFIAAAALPVQVGTIQKLDPPWPDIRCMLDGQQHFFELTRVAEQALADDIGKQWTAVKKGLPVPPSGFHSFRDSDLLADAMARKAGNEYHPDAHLIDLLVYCDGMFHATIEPSFVLHCLPGLQALHGDQWNRIWVFDAPEGRIIWPPESHT